MAEAAESELRPRDVLIVAAVALVLIDIAFFVLCRQYYIERYKGYFAEVGIGDASGGMAWDRTKEIFFWSFCTFSVTTVGAVTAAVLYPRYVAHFLATVFGLTYVIAAMLTWCGSMPALVGFAEIVIGGLLLALTWVSWHRKDRAAWAFLLSLCVALAITHLFGAPRVRNALGIELWYALTVCGLMIGAAVGFYRLRRDLTR